MSNLELQLACLLASYEMDEPHINMPDLDVGDEASQHYPDIDGDKFLSWLKEPHQGDCIKLPAPCIRCYAEMIAHKAKWLAERLDVRRVGE